MSDRGEPRWQPLSALPVASAHVREGVRLAAEHLQTLGQARTRPYLLGDADIARVIATFSQTREDFVTLWAVQGQRWADLDLDEATRRQVEQFQTLVARGVGLVEEILTLAEQLRTGTIETVMAKSDLHLGLEALLGTRLPPP